jgi:Domain of unknown function (DUF5664)
MPDFKIKDSGERQSYDSGMVRDVQEGKPRFDLMWPLNVPFDEQFMTRIAMHLTKGIAKYGERNWEKADSQEELDRFRASAMRHLMQWYCGDRDEDHAAAVVFNLISAETVEYKLRSHGLAVTSGEAGSSGNWTSDIREAHELWE